MIPRSAAIALLMLAVRLGAQTEVAETSSSAHSTEDIPRGVFGSSELERPAPAPVNGLLPAPARGSAGYIVNDSQDTVDWAGLFRASSRFLGLEHSFRLLTEPGTRTGLTGSFFGNYGSAIGNLHGWADGDEFYVNYIGHPMQGSVAGFLWIQNDRAYRGARFSKDRLYWRSRLRAAAFAWAYSEQFEIGPLSEASIGAIQAQFPQQGFVDHVVTPSVGLAWMVAEDALDRFVVERVESATGNRYIRLVARSTLNPCRTLANVLQLNVPWLRQTRGGVMSFAPVDRRSQLPKAVQPSVPEPHDEPGPAPFEFALTFQPQRFLGGGRVSCVGGGGSGAVRLADSWQLVVEVEGCKFLGLEENLSGDSLTYMTGPRFRTRDWGRWSANLQFLIGGNKLTEERMFPEVKAALEAAAARDPRVAPPTHSDYTEDMARNAFAFNGGGGVNYKLNSALTIRVADLSYQHSWAGPLGGRSYSDALKLSAGLVLRMGTW